MRMWLLLLQTLLLLLPPLLLLPALLLLLPAKMLLLPLLQVLPMLHLLQMLPLLLLPTMNLKIKLADQIEKAQRESALPQITFVPSAEEKSAVVSAEQEVAKVVEEVPKFEETNVNSDSHEHY
ncbi:unnamed protein product, partial [Mesorhabditis spiculigera]